MVGLDIMPSIVGFGCGITKISLDTLEQACRISQVSLGSSSIQTKSINIKFYSSLLHSKSGIVPHPYC